ncbi:MAG: hypothetical protein ACPGVD_03660 [Flavobacteriales bacterium]
MIWKYLGFFLLSSVKFIFSPFLAKAAIPEGSWLLTFLFVSGGGIAGATFFYYSASYFLKRAAKKTALKSRKKFTRTNRLIIRTKHKVGVYGLAFLTASFISIPIGSIILAKFYRHEKSTIYILYGTISLIAFILTSFAYIY